MQIALYMAVMGAGFGIGTGFLVNFCTQHFSLKNNFIAGALIAALASLVTVVFLHPEFSWITIAPLGAAIAVAYSAILTMFSNQVDADSQGWVMGITGAIMAFAFGMNSVLIGMLADLSPRVPLFLATGCLIISAVIMHFFQGIKEEPEKKVLMENK